MYLLTLVTSRWQHSSMEGTVPALLGWQKADELEAV